MEAQEVRIKKSSKFEKLTPLYVDYSCTGNLRVKRWRPQWGIANDKPNAVAVENLPAGGVATVDFSNGIAELRAKRS